MCGIAGMLRLAADRPALDRAELARISAALARRGPDGEKAWASARGRALLAHRRLAILDPSHRADQPMISADGRHTLVLNGEIYDFREHRQRLVADGIPLRTTGDAEVLLELLVRDGPDVLSSLRGMYAFALWDERRGELLLGRDPYGIKPLYYAVHDGVLRFASQVRALEAGGGLPLDVDRAAVAGFLAWGSIPEPRTLRSAVRALPAGHLLRATADGPVRLEPLPFRPPEREPRPVEEAIEECVRDHLVSDVPVSLFLSAGLDSALVAALARRRLSEPPTALTLTFAEARGTARDEEDGARAIAAALGLRHVVREVAGGEVRELLPEIVAAMDQPSIDGFNTWLVARLARQEGFKVALSGLGGDELLGGYPSFRETAGLLRRARRLARVPFLARVWAPLARKLDPDRPKLAGALRHGAASLAGAWMLQRALHLPEELPGHGHGGPLHDPALEAWERLGDGILGSSDGILEDPWKAVHRLESTIYLKNQLLCDADWAGMAHGVEIRVPLVDARLRAELEAHDFEPARSEGKRALVRRLAPELPAAIFDRPKTGFQLPVADWLEPDPARGEQRVGLQSRRLARLVLEAFGVDAGSGAQ